MEEARFGTLRSVDPGRRTGGAQFTSSVSAGGPAAEIWRLDAIPEFVRKGYFEPIDETLSAETEVLMPIGLVRQAGAWQGRTYGFLDSFIHSYGIYYNRALFAAEGACGSGARARESGRAGAGRSAGGAVSANGRARIRCYRSAERGNIFESSRRRIQKEKASCSGFAGMSTLSDAGACGRAGMFPVSPWRRETRPIRSHITSPYR